MPNILKALQAAAGNGPSLAVDDVFSVSLYTGNGSTQSITNGIDLSGEGGLVWIKNRDQADSHILTDTARGAGEVLSTNATTAETTDADTTTAFNSDGFSIGADVKVNTNTEDYVSWTFRKAEKFFTVVPYTGDGNASQTINHDLGSTPGCIIVKNLSQADAWYVYHRSNTASPETDYLVLNTNAGTVDSAGAWNDTAPTSTQFTVGTDDNVNASGESYVAYLFAHDAGGFGDGGSESIIKCGSYTGGTDGTTFVDLGFEPQLLILKRADSFCNWAILDTMRGLSAAQGTPTHRLEVSTSGAEVTAGVNGAYVSSTGFYPWGNGGGDWNASGGTYIYIAIRRPMKTPEAGTEVFATRVATEVEYNNTVDYGITTDLLLNRYNKSGSQYTMSFDRMRGSSKILYTALTDAEGTLTLGTGNKGFGASQTSVTWPQIANSSASNVTWAFKRATGFFDVVCYEGTGSAHAETHNLGVVPELIIVKNRDAADAWAVYVGDETDYLVLNTTAATADDATYWNDTAPTSTQFTVGTQAVVNTSGESYVAYLFATLAGISKVGSYTGTAANIDVDCGFSTGARFILIKRTDSTGDWYVWDSERGIVAGNDPYLLLNSTAAEVTSTDYIDPLSSGFTVTSSAPAALNASGGTYIYLAIA